MREIPSGIGFGTEDATTGGGRVEEAKGAICAEWRAGVLSQTACVANPCKRQDAHPTRKVIAGPLACRIGLSRRGMQCYDPRLPMVEFMERMP